MPQISSFQGLLSENVGLLQIPQGPQKNVTKSMVTQYDLQVAGWMAGRPAEPGFQGLERPWMDLYMDIF